MKILWIKYRKRPFNPDAYCYYHSAEWVVYRYGSESRFVVAEYDGSSVERVTNSRGELRMFLDLKDLRIGKFYGYSEMIYDAYDCPDWVDFLWRGYELEEM